MNQHIDKTQVDGIDLPVNEMSKQVLNSIERLSSEETTIRIDARNQLVKMGREILPYMHKLLKSKEKQLRWEAAKTIEIIGNPKSIPYLLDMLKEQQTEFRWIASEGLINIGRESIVPLLQTLIENDETLFLRSSARYVLNELFTAKELNRYSKLMDALKNEKQLGSIAASEAQKVLSDLRNNQANSLK